MLLTISVLKQREVPATVSSFYVSVLYTAMLRTSIAAVVLGCFYFCQLDCDASVMVVDCAAVETGCMLEKYTKVAHLLRVLQQKGIYTYLVRIQNFPFIFRLMRYTDVWLFSLSGVLFPRDQTTHLNETVKHDKIRESDRYDGWYMYIPSFALLMYKTTCHAKPFLYRSV